LLEGIQDRVNGSGEAYLDVWMSHGDKVTALPPGLQADRLEPGLPDRRHGRRGAPLLRGAVPSGVTHTKQGRAIYTRFVHEICGVGPSWNMPQFVPQAIEKIRAQVGKDEVILGLSGGVDSAVAAALILSRYRRPAHLHLRRHGLCCG
jgi:GMP synthase (glutamine-hydrolysing)